MNMNQNQNHPWEHLLLTAFHHSQVLVCQHLMGTTNITQALLKVTEGGFVSKIFDLISLRTERGVENRLDSPVPAGRANSNYS